MIPSVITYPDVTRTARGIANRLILYLIEHQSLGAPIHISLTGGSLGSAIWPEVAAHPLVRSVKWWQDIHLWFSDERFVPADDPQRNDRAVLDQARELRLPATRIHRVPGPDLVADVGEAAEAYATELAGWADYGDIAWPAPVFAVSILGIGPDGHVASLFPGHDELAVRDRTTVAVWDSPKPPPQRVSFTQPLLNRCDELWMIAAGADKAPVVDEALFGDDPARPATGLCGRRRTVWLVDAALHDQQVDLL